MLLPLCCLDYIRQLCLVWGLFGFFQRFKSYIHSLILPHFFSSSIISEKSHQLLHFIQIETYSYNPTMTCFVLLNIMFLRFICVFAIDAIYSFTASVSAFSGRIHKEFILFLIFGLFLVFVCLLPLL